MPPLNSDSLARLAGVHAQAWQGLLSSTAAVATLPIRTVQTLTGWPEVAVPSPTERLAEAEDAIRALMVALETERRARESEAELSRARALEHEALVTELRQSYARLESDVETRLAQARQDQALALYQTLEPLLTQLPVVRHAVGAGREVAAADLLALLGPLDQATTDLGVEAIGRMTEELPFDPLLHQVARGPMPEPGETVTVRHVGYRLGDRILRRARVSRTDGT